MRKRASDETGRRGYHYRLTQHSAGAAHCLGGSGKRVLQFGQSGGRFPENVLPWAADRVANAWFSGPCTEKPHGIAAARRERAGEWLTGPAAL